MYTTPGKKNKVMESFLNSGGNIRLIIATTAFAMGVDCPGISRIIHWGIPSTIEEYIQEIGCAGRDGEDAIAILY